MKFLIVLSVLICLIAIVYASSNNGNSVSAARRNTRRLNRKPRPQPITLASEEDERPSPYEFNYSSNDGESDQSRQESGDENGTVKGSYSYRDAFGIYRTVDYIADKDGFRAVVSSNEPGLGSTENPADVTMNVQEPPAGAYNVRRKSKKASRRNNF